VIRFPALLAALIILVALAATGCGRGGKKASDVIARVNGQAVTKTQLDDALERSENGEAAKRTLDSLIVRELIREEAKKRSITVSKEELDRRMNALKDYVLAMTGKDFLSWLADSGQSEEEMRTSLSMQILTAKLVFTDTDRKRFFDDRQADLKNMPHNNESVIYREIVVGSQQEAEAVRKELLAQAKDGKVSGEAFGKIAEQRSLDPNARRNGGMGGWVAKGKSQDPKLEQVLFGLKPGEISEAVSVPTPALPAGQKAPATLPQQPTLYRVVMVEKHLTPGPLTLENNEDVIEEWMMKDPRYQGQLGEFFNNLRAKASIEIVDPRFRSLDEAYRQAREAREQQRSMMQPGAMAPGMPPSGQAPAPAPSAPPTGK
jgi:parvulin-like peptidyl-prolyl isomerase